MKVVFGVRVFVFVALFFAVSSVWGQKKESAPKCKNVTVFDVNYEDDKAGAQVKESFTSYDATGNITEFIDYDKEGKEKEHILYEYDKEGHKTKETYLKANGNKDKVEEYIYQNGLKTEKIVYYGNGKIKSKKRYVYVL